MGGNGYHRAGHDGGVGDVDSAHHVCSVGFGGELDSEVCDGEAVQLVQLVHA